MGLCRIIQPSQNPEVPSEDPSTNHQPSMVCNKSLPYTKMSIPQVRTVLQQQIATHPTALQSHPNPLMAQVLNQPESRRLQRRWTLDEKT